MKKIIISVLLGCLLLSSVACKSRSKGMDALKGKEGVFAVLETEKGQVILNLFYKETPMTVTNFVGLAEGICLWGFLVALLILFV